MPSLLAWVHVGRSPGPPVALWPRSAVGPPSSEQRANSAAVVRFVIRSRLSPEPQRLSPHQRERGTVLGSTPLQPPDATPRSRPGTVPPPRADDYWIMHTYWWIKSRTRLSRGPIAPGTGT